MTSLEGDVYQGQNKLYAWYQFSTDISSTGNLPDLSGNGYNLFREDYDDRPGAPIPDSPSSGKRSPVGFPNKSALFNSSILEYHTTTKFSFGNGSSDLPFSVSTWVKFTTIREMYLVTKWHSAATGREWYLFIHPEGNPKLVLFDHSEGSYILSQPTGS